MSDNNLPTRKEYRASQGIDAAPAPVDPEAWASGKLDPVTDGPSFVKRTQKAWAGGFAGLVTGGAGSAVMAMIQTGNFSTENLWAALALGLGGFLVGFGGVYAAPANKA